MRTIPAFLGLVLSLALASPAFAHSDSKWIKGPQGGHIIDAGGGMDVIADLARLLGRLAARQDVEAEELDHARRPLRPILQRSSEPNFDQ